MRHTQIVNKFFRIKETYPSEEGYLCDKCLEKLYSCILTIKEK